MVAAAHPSPLRLLSPSAPLRHALLTLARSPALRELAGRFPPARSMARRFVAGETRTDALAAVRALRARGILATVDYLGENVTDRVQAEAAAAEYERLADELSGQAHVSLKLTAMGLDLDAALARSLVSRVAARASFVRIDMEGSAYTERTLALFRELRREHPNVGIVLQAYLRRTARDVDEAIRTGARVRLCKGAYDEPPSIAYPLKADVDANYLALAERLVEEADYPAFATHDERIIDEIARLGRPGRFEFQMLYGVRRDLQRRLVQQGQTLRVYVPYGTHWYPYFMRRLAERPANLLFFLRSAAAG